MLYYISREIVPRHFGFMRPPMPFTIVLPPSSRGGTQCIGQSKG